MERLIDKLIVLICCLPVAAIAGTLDPLPVLAAVILTCLAEAFPRYGRALCPVALAALALVLPGVAALLPLAAYDLAQVMPADLRTAAFPHDGAAPRSAATSSPAQPEPRAIPRPSAIAALCCLPLVYLGARTMLGAAPLALTFALCCAAALLAARTRDVARQSRANHAQRDALRAQALGLAEKNRDLMDRQDYEVRIAVLEERSRIARAIHDDVGHLLTRSILQAEAQHVVHADDPAVSAAFAQVGATLSEALATVRASVHDLHDDAVDLAAQVQRVIDGSGLDITARIQVEAAPPAVATCLVAVAREACSNIARHASGARATLELVEHPAFWKLAIWDDGGAQGAAGNAAHADAAPASGLGLISMEERVRALGGTFSAGPDHLHGGFAVTATVPKRHEKGSPR